MIKFKIANNVVRVASQLVLKLNRKEEADSGYVKVLSSRQERYEPYSIVEIEWNDKSYRMLVESDNVLKQKSNLYEHEITLIETMAILSTVYPVDRSFSNLPAKTLGEILDVYEKELRYYQGFSLRRAFIRGVGDTKIVEKEYPGVDMAVIIYDLFRSIDMIPRLRFNNNYWVLSGEPYIRRGREITLSIVENEETQVNDIDYATGLLHKSRNASIEKKGMWWPAIDKWAYPTFKGDMYKTSDLQFELDSDILNIYQVLALAEVTVTHSSGQFNTNLSIDITRSTLEEEIYESVVTKEGSTYLDLLNMPDWQWYEQSYISPGELFKQIAIKYKKNNNVIDGLFWQNAGILKENITSFRNAVNSYALIEAKKQYPNLTITSAVIRTGVVAEDIKLRVYYQPKRDVDFITERQDTKKFNQSTILKNQKDSMVDLTSLMRNADLYINRIGNKTILVTQSKEYWELGDYTIIDDEYWLITDITYNYDKDECIIIAEFTRNFANVNRETALSRVPSSYVYTGKKLQSNFILKEYILFGGDVEDDTIIPDSLKKVAMNLLDYREMHNKPVTNAFLNDTTNIGSGASKKLVNAPLLTGGSGNTIVLHASMKDPRVAGNSSFKYKSSYYKKPILYTKSDFTIDKLYFTLARDYTVDGRDYPSVYVSEDDELLTYQMPVDKDPNDTLAVTWQLLSKSLDKNVIVYNGFAKYNNLVNFFEIEPNIKLYTRPTPYDKLETKLTVNDSQISKAYSYMDVVYNTLIVQDILNEPIKYWALAYGDELILGANNNVREIKIRFKKKVEYKGYLEDEIIVESEFTYSPQFFIDVNVTEDAFKSIEYIIRPEVFISSSVGVNVVGFEYIKHTLQPTITLGSNLNEQINEYAYISYAIQPTITLSHDINSEYQSAEYIDVTLQPTITLSGEISSQVNEYSYVKHMIQPLLTLNNEVSAQTIIFVPTHYTIQPLITLDVSGSQVSGKPEYYLEQLSPPQTDQIDADDYGFIKTFANGSAQTTIEDEIGSIENYLGVIVSIYKGYIEQTAQTTPEFTLTVSQSEAYNYNAIMSAMQSQQSAYYNEVTTNDVPQETNFKVDDGYGNTYFKILLVANRKNYYEVKKRII